MTKRSPHQRRRLAIVGTAALLLVGTLAACGDSDDTTAKGEDGTGNGDATLTMYSGQHEDLAQSLVDAFETETGIKIEIRSGDDAELVNQIIEEGDRTKADLVITEEPGPIAQLDAKGVLAKVDQATLDSVDPRLVPADGNWTPYAARSRAMFYNPDLIAEDELPASIMDLAKPEWKGKFAYAPSGAFVTTVTYLVNTIGEDETLAWLKAIKANGINEQKNGQVRDSVEAGRHAFGLSNHYYWYILADQEGGAENLKSRVHFVGGQDAGGLVLASGAGVLKSSKHQKEAQQFLAWVASADGGQKIIANDTPQYPVGKGVESTKDLKPLAELEPPEFDQGSLTDLDKARQLLVEAGIV
jgi:iron(III) transport system substrate-binding protein